MDDAHIGQGAKSLVVRKPDLSGNQNLWGERTQFMQPYWACFVIPLPVTTVRTTNG